MSHNAPAGWYPQRDGSERWWDGQAWSPHSRPIPPPPMTPMGSAHVAGVYGSDQPAAWAPPPAAYAVAPKNAALSVLASFFLPGLGTMINGEVGKGVGILVSYFICLFLFFLIVPLLAAAGIWIWGMVDAYQGAQLWNRRHGILS